MTANPDIVAGGASLYSTAPERRNVPGRVRRARIRAAARHAEHGGTGDARTCDECRTQAMMRCIRVAEVDRPRVEAQITARRIDRATVRNIAESLPTGTDPLTVAFTAFAAYFLIRALRKKMTANDSDS